MSSETWYLDGLEFNSGKVSDLIIVAELFQKREPAHKYDVEHLGSQFLILTDGGGRYLNNRLCSCPLVFFIFNTRIKQKWKIGMKFYLIIL